MNTILLDPGIWVPEGNYIPGDAIYEGTGADCVIRSENPAQDHIKIGPRTILRNVSIHDAFGEDNPIAMHFTANGPRDITYWHNATPVDVVSEHWCGTAVYVHGGQDGTDRPVAIFKVNGDWNAAVYAGSKGHSYGVHSEAWDASIPFLAWQNGTQPAIKVVVKPGANPEGGALFFQPETPHDSSHIQITDTHKTTGSFISAYHADSPFHGSFIHANLGNGAGAFTGYVVDIQNAGVPVFQVTHEGDLVAGRLADRIAALEARIEALENGS